MAKGDKTHLVISQDQWGYLRDHSARIPLLASVNLEPEYGIGTTLEAYEKNAHMDHVVESASIDCRAIRTPCDAGDWTSEFKHRHRFFPRVVSPFPHAYSAIIACRGEEFDASATCESPVKRVDDLAVGTEFAYALPGG